MFPYAKTNCYQFDAIYSEIQAILTLYWVLSKESLVLAFFTIKTLFFNVV